MLIFSKEYVSPSVITLFEPVFYKVPLNGLATMSLSFPNKEIIGEFTVLL